MVPLDAEGMRHHRRTLLDLVGRAFSKEGIQMAMGSDGSEFADAGFSVEVDDSAGTSAPSPIGPSDQAAVSMAREDARLVVSYEGKGQRETMGEIARHTAWTYYQFLLQDLLPSSFALCSDRIGISLFHQELDFERNEALDVLYRLGDTKSRASVRPVVFLTGTSDRHSHSVNDNVDFTRNLADLRGQAAGIPHARKLAAQVRRMMGGYYGSVGDDIRFISRARGADPGFNIPLHQASSSARGLSDLYFFVRHQAAVDQLLVIDCPESHLDTRNQVRLARLLAGLVAAGVSVLVVTHSDHLVKEINNLIMIHTGFPKTGAVARRLGYRRADRLDPSVVRAYVAENGGLTECRIGPFGMEMPVLDETVDRINQAAIELSRAGDGW